MLYIPWDLPSGATPADLLVFSSTYLWTGIGEFQNWDLLCHCSQCETRQTDTLLTELCRLGTRLLFFVFVKKINGERSLAFAILNSGWKKTMTKHKLCNKSSRFSYYNFRGVSFFLIHFLQLSWRLSQLGLQVIIICTKWNRILHLRNQTTSKKSLPFNVQSCCQMSSCSF